MCGIAGIIQYSHLPQPLLKQSIDNMLHAMQSRGPESQGIFQSKDFSITLAHTRLAIIDRSSRGHQPMISEDKRLVLGYNGELFDYQGLKNSLGGCYRSETDTEVLLKYLSTRKNIGKALANLDGMFAFALFDQHTDILILARDHFGIKPLYCFQCEKFFIFASEPWAIFASGLVQPEISHEFFPLLASVKMEAELEETWYKGIKQLMPASMLTIYVKTGKMTTEVYWQPQDQELIFSPEQLNHAFSTAVKNRIPADRERAVFLSGGVDSTSIVELHRQRIDVLPCVITYKNEPVSEDLQFARSYAESMNFILKEIIVDPQKNNLLNDGTNAVQRPILHGGELGMLVAYEKLQQLGITVCYSGHGADELWGYQESEYFPMVSNTFSADMHSPYYLRQYYSKGHYAEWTTFLNQFIYPFFSTQQAQIENKIWEKIFSDYRQAPFLDPYKKARYHMMKRFLLYVNNMIDRTSMYFSIENRPIFQNIAMCQLAFSLPEYIKNREGITQCKPFLKQSLCNLLPTTILNRQKIGFQPPRHELFRSICLDVLVQQQPFDLHLKLGELEKYPMNQLFFLASSQLILNKLTEFKKKFYKKEWVS